MSVRRAILTARLAGQQRTIDSLSVSHGFVLDGGGTPGLDGSVTWADEAPVDVPALPSDADWDRGPGESLTIDWTDDQGTARVATARLDGADGDGLGGVTSSLTDWTSRLSTQVEIRPVAAVMPRNLSLPGSVKRRVNLVPTWLTVEALRQAGWNTCQAMQTSSVAYHQMGGSAWPSPDPDSTHATMGEVRQAYRLDDYGDVDVTQAPGVTQGDDMPVMTNLYLLGQTRTRRRSSVAHWQMTQDLGVRKPDAGDRGRSTVRPLRSSDGPGMRLDWTSTQVRVQRVSPLGGTVTLGTYPRGESMRWSVVVRANGTATVYNDLSGSTPVAQLTGTGVTDLPTDSSPASYVLEWPGRASAFQLTRSDSSFLVTQTVGARVQRHAFSGRWIAGFDHDVRSAGDFLTHQARAQVGWRGIGLLQWVDEDGRLQNTDFYSLASGPIRHTLSTASTDDTALDGSSWSSAGSGPWRAVTVTARRPNVQLRDAPTLLLGEGSRETIPRGERLEQFIHPATDETWLHIDTSAYLPGHPYGAPTNKEFDNQHGTWTGGHKVDEDGKPAGWITVNDVVEWSLTASGEVRGALSVLDPRTVLVSGTVNTPVGLSMSTMPSPASSGLPEHRKSQALAQVRGAAKIEWDEHAITVPITGDDRHQSYTHDLGMYVTNPAEMEYAAAELAASITDPAVLHTARVAINPRVRVGDKVALRHTYSTGWTRTVVGVVARRSLAPGGDRDVMTLTVVRTSDSITPPTEPLPPLDPSPPAPAPILPPGPRPDPDPPIDPDDPPVVDPPPRPSAPAVTVHLDRLHIGWDGLDSTGAPPAPEQVGGVEVSVSPSPFGQTVVGRATLDSDGWWRYTHGPVTLDSTWYVQVRLLDIWGQAGLWSVSTTATVPPLVDPGQFDDALDRITDAEEGLDDLAADLAAIGAALPDPEFTDPDAWDVPSGSTWLTDLTDHPYGRTTGLTVPGGANTTGAVATLPVEPGQRWWTAVLVRPEASSTSTTLAGLEVQWLRESGTVLSTQWVDSRPLRDYTPDEWVLLSGYAVAPDDAASVRVRVRRSSTIAPAWTLASARLLRASGGIADPVVLAGFIGALKIDVAQLVVTEGATINEAVILKLAADLAEFIEVKASNITAGTLAVLTELLVQVGQDEVAIGSPAGGIAYRVPVSDGAGGTPTMVPVARMGREYAAIDPVTGDQTVMNPGGISGPTGRFESLEVAGQSVQDVIDERGGGRVVVRGYFTQTRGPYTQMTGYAEVGWTARAGRGYMIHVDLRHRTNADGAHTEFRLPYSTGPAGTNPPSPQASGQTLDAHWVRHSPVGSDAPTETFSHYWAPSPDAAVTDDLAVRLGLAFYGSSATGSEVIRASIRVQDAGPTVWSSGRYNLMGAPGTPTPPPTAPPQSQNRTWTYAWEEVYSGLSGQTPTRAGHTHIGSNAWAGDFMPWRYQTIWKVPAAARSAMTVSGASEQRIRIRFFLFDGLWGAPGTAILGLASTGSSSPANAPTLGRSMTITGLRVGAWAEYELPAAWVSDILAGTRDTIILGDARAGGQSRLQVRNVGHSTHAPRLRGIWTET